MAERDDGGATELLEEELKAQRLLHEAGALCARPGIPTEHCLERFLDVAIAIAAADKGTIHLTDTDGVTLLDPANLVEGNPR